MTELRLDGRIAVVTGAGHGLGRSHALGLAARGARLVVNDTDGAAAARVVGEIRDRGGLAVSDDGDVSAEDEADALIETAVESFGRVDIVVNNAGLLRDRAFKNITVAEWDRVVGVHLRGTFLVTRAAFGHMRANGFGRIITTTSPSGLFGNFGQSNYAAAKMGVIGLTKTLAIEGAGYDITANALAPVAYTRLTEDLFPPSARENLAPERVTPLVLWLAHEDCETTGEIYSVGGGRVARVFVAEGPGAAPAEDSPEALRDCWPEVNAERPYVIPRNLSEQAGAYLRGLA
ncbi:NAD(P)-dependent dehydrogenase (short-subunit alcohol dehydrogenase family) [Nocardiopsis mwathae]|uniref:NAD(P)-dependent dehydrogenase (Short-subunit alcohol dehydrogenase family) n=1 Tax=Nocardiopsis mwathae TaxID=1472723 RepID=A0A7W9YKG6_9ACTN|nr:SDR family NAD(P)-dependent oxidoreductase [Nocardiopsis mwathae]MBB6173176.1 NAD(P)-dependent dehydrogenase (short-subunit alcohol dehydrogenase family) [Nocardiopsis mwathae]